MALVAREGAGVKEVGSEVAAVDESIAQKLTDLVNGVIQQTQTTMEELVPMIANINSCYMEVTEDVQQAKEDALARKAKLEEERDKFQQAACGILELLGVVTE